MNRTARRGKSVVLDPVLSPVLTISLIFLYTYIKKNILSTGVQKIFNIYIQNISDTINPNRKSVGHSLYWCTEWVKCLILHGVQEHSTCCVFVEVAQ